MTCTNLPPAVRAEVDCLLAHADTPDDARLVAVSMHRSARAEAAAYIEARAPGTGRKVEEADRWAAVAAALVDAGAVT